MKNFYRLIQFVAQFVTLGLALAFVVSWFAPQWTARLRGPANDAQPPALPTESDSPRPQAAKPAVRPPKPGVAFGPGNGQNNEPSPESGDTITTSYSHAVDVAGPAVVSIYVNKIETKKIQTVYVPRDPRLRDAIPPIPAGPPHMSDVATRGLGSGVIVNSDGYVLTNYHVIQNATEISAVMPDGRSVAAKLIGSDAETDLAVLKLDVWNQTAIPIAENPAAAGDVVLAIGNPFGFNKTVTMGIVSAVGRIDPTTGESLIQTDAAINSGNSGGALVNAYGELVGINSLTFSPSGNGGNVGISFAVPVDVAKKVLQQIIEHGRVIRSWMGASYRDRPPQSNDPMPVVTNGAEITAIESDSPADKAGLKVGDVIQRFDGKFVPNELTLRNRESQLAPGTKVAVSAQRNGHPLRFDMELTERPSLPQPQAQGQPSG
jgi:S1-C subfamily serine protease